MIALLIEWALHNTSDIVGIFIESLIDSRRAFLFFFDNLGRNLFSNREGELRWLIIRGQSNLGKYIVFLGSVFVRDMVYPLRPWNACRKWITWEQARFPVGDIFSYFPIKSGLQCVFIGESPPSMKKYLVKWFFPAIRAKVLNKFSILRGVHVGQDWFNSRACWLAFWEIQVRSSSDD